MSFNFKKCINKFKYVCALFLSVTLKHFITPALKKKKKPVYPGDHCLGAYTKMPRSFLELCCPPLLAAVPSLVHTCFCGFGSVCSQWIPSSGLLDQKANAYLIFRDIVKFPSIGIVCFVFSAVDEGACFLTDLPLECVVNKLLDFCQSDR